MTDVIELSVVAFEEDGLWTAQALEHDIAAFADSLPRVMKKFERAIYANLALNRELGRPGLDGIAPAPERYRILYEQSDLDVRRRGDAASAGLLPARIRDLRIAEAA